MASPTYSARAIVLRKTKLGETDLILTLLAHDGSQLRAVAKGARKPKSSFSSRLELFSVVDLLCSEGRSLDLVKEARLVEGNVALRQSVEHTSAASCMAELLAKLSQDGLENRIMFDASVVAFAELARTDAAHAPAVCAAHLLKMLAANGLRPHLGSCIVCGAEADFSLAETAFSFSDGGVACPECRSRTEAVLLPAATLQWARWLLGSTFADIAAAEADVSAAFSVLRFTQQLIAAHVGGRLKSLEFMFSCGLF